MSATRHATSDAARDHPHVPRRDVAPPAVVEAEGEEDDEVDHDDRDDRALEQRPVVDRDAVVEAELEGEVPRGGDEQPVGGELPDAVAVDRDHARTGDGGAHGLRHLLLGVRVDPRPEREREVVARRAARSRAASPPGSRGRRARAGGGAAAGSSARSRSRARRARPGSRRAAASGRRRGGRRGRARRRASRRSRRARARGSGPRPRGAPASSRRARGRKIRSAAAWTSSRREL